MRTTPYHPMGNGQPERFNRTLLTMIGTLPRVEKANWQNWVNHLTHAYNCTKSKVTGFSPYFLMFGREPRIPVDEAFKVTFPFRQEKNVHEYVHHLRERLQWAYNIAKEHIDKDVAWRKLYYDRRYHCMEIIPGDIVLVYQKVFGSDHKIADRWEIPAYKVLRRSRVTDQYLQFKELGLVVIIQLRTFIAICCTLSLVWWVKKVKLSLQWRSWTLQCLQFSGILEWWP